MSSQAQAEAEPLRSGSFVDLTHPSVIQFVSVPLQKCRALTTVGCNASPETPASLGRFDSVARRARQGNRPRDGFVSVSQLGSDRL
jgi:hypothetical protein